MNYEKAMIPITLIILVGILGIAGIGSGAISGISLGDYGEPFNNKQIIPDKSIDTSSDGFYEYCYRMGLDC